MEWFGGMRVAKLRKRKGSGHVPPQAMTRSEKATVIYVFVVGCVCILACFTKAIGFLIFEELQPIFQAR